MNFNHCQGDTGDIDRRIPTVAMAIPGDTNRRILTVVKEIQGGTDRPILTVTEAILGDTDWQISIVAKAILEKLTNEFRPLPRRYWEALMASFDCCQGDTRRD